MKGLDIFIVRFLPFVLFIIFCINVWCEWNGIEGVTIGYELHGNSALYALGFFLVSLSNKRYHCIWNRAMYLYLILIPCFNFIDARFDIVPDTRAYIIVIWASAIITAIITAFLAVRHFILISKIKFDDEYRTNHNKRQPRIIHKSKVSN